ncbi:MAG TPA: hypothetical protein VL463_01460 [Kofleriaceae bacterium]|jgi:hypothetical protein|nr:hypothetical protein [Kofleriaceae bacterium]
MAFVFGKHVESTCIQDLPDPGPNGEALCLAYRVESYGLVFPGYTRDGGYAIQIKGSRASRPIDDAWIAKLQQRGVLPDPLPSYSIPASTYAWGFSLWPVIALVLLVTWVRRRSAMREHVVEKPAPGASAIEVTASHSILNFFMFICAPTIRIDDRPYLRTWGTWTFPVEPGTHVVRVTYRWLWDRAEQRMDLPVEAGETKCVRYHVGLFFSRIKLESAAPTARVERAG